MKLAPGARVGPYEITAPLGAGGMGEVYRARDVRLGREVAIKILPPQVAADQSRRERFEREARHVAGLNHPNILVLYDIGTADEIAFMATELVDGDSLRGLSLPFRKSLDIAAQIADALAAAHGAGVTHRDLKPDNVMVSRDGRVKLLDFGIAKASAGGSDVTIDQTDAGSVVGTAPYMAPEQVRGAAVDHRTDIFAFGALLYELLSGRRAFDGETAAETMTAILKQDSPEMPLSVPVGVRQIVHRCLEKKPEERFQSARDLAFALRQLSGDTSSSATLPTIARPRTRGRTVWIAAATLIAGAVSGALLALTWSQARDATIDPIKLTRFSPDRLTETYPAFSPDGRSIAYLRYGRGSELMVQSVDAPSAVAVAASNTAMSRPVWTTDGTRICYTTVARDLMCVSASGGTPQRVLAEVSSPQFMTDGSLVFIRVADGAPAYFLSTPPGSDPVLRADLPTALDIQLRVLSPDSSRMLLLRETSLSVMSMRDGSTRAVPLPAGARPWAAAWMPDHRHIVLSQTTQNPLGFTLVMADTETGAQRLIYRDSGAISGVSVSPDGKRVVFASGPAEWDIAEFEMSGTRRRTAVASGHMDRFPSWSPRGDRWLLLVGGPGREDAIWTAADGTEPTPLLTLPSEGLAAAFRYSPDGGRIAYLDAGGITTVSSAGGRPIRIHTSSQVGSGLCWSPDGEWIWFTDAGATLHKVPSSGGSASQVANTVGAVLDCSPDGRWLSVTGRQGFELISSDGRERRAIGNYVEYASRGDNTMQFGDGGRVLYALGQGRRSIDIIDTATGARRNRVTFQIGDADIIQGFSVHPDGTRVLLTTGLQREDLWLVEGFAQPATGWRRWLGHWQPQ